ncbi:hypothetical protein FHW96_002711 [Novosphingobium sp. SG751A]|uniref:hypothetical protein n=1 Tax=Novosphingobium sp. SG751A TaxID=2587000 RepID=UPI001554712C|nr:hypothetical protein [Novosphingobium sp. SG751A]NOW46551.1 hypothetical protein [Novosphingobium sp. SG751A]
MIKHVLLIAVLEEMEKLEIKLGALFEKRPEDWQEIYAATRRQIKLCIAELAKLAHDDLDMSEKDTQRLREVSDAFHDQTVRHQERWPVERIDLADPLYVQSFQTLRKASTAFKAVMYGLIERYHIQEEDT